MKTLYQFLALALLAISSTSVMAQLQPSITLDHSCSETKIAHHTQRALQNKKAASDEYYRLMTNYDISYYKLDIALERTSTFISGSCNIQATVLQALDTFEFELYPTLAIDSVLINGQNTNFMRLGTKTTVLLTQTIPAGSSVNALIYYRGNPPSGGSAAIGNGMSNGSSPTWGNNVTWSLSEPYAALEWFPVKQALGDKADSSAVYITTDSTNMAGSNGVLKGIDVLPNGKHRYRWESRYPIAYYLISVSVSNYNEYSFYAHPTGADSILIQNYIYDHPNLLNTYKTEIDYTDDMLEAFSDIFGLYPFAEEKYGHTMVPIGGGMEHQTMTSQGYFSFTLTAHELGHQWFGDDVTCASWRDVWVNEGFASYSENLALEFLGNPNQSASLMLQKHSSVKNQAGGSVYLNNPLDTNNVGRIFNGRLSYDKGSSILHTIRYVVDNDSLFFLTLRNFRGQYGDSVATGADFRDVLMATTGINFIDYFNQWYYGEGYPTFSVNWNVVNDTLLIHSAQAVSRPSVTPLFTLPMEYRLQRTGAPDTVVRVMHGQPSEWYVFPQVGTVTAITVDPANGVINNATVQKNTNITTSLEDGLSLAGELQLYPNPTKDRVTVSLPTVGNYRLQLIDMGGRVLQTKSINGATGELDLRKLSEGIYLIKATDGDNVNMIKKIIKE